MRELPSYLCGEWTPGVGDAVELVDPTTEAPICVVRSPSEPQRALAHARRIGIPALGRTTMAERSALLRRMAKAVHAHRDALCELAASCGGNTRQDAKFDIDGGIAVLSSYADLTESLPDRPYWAVGQAQALVRGGKLSVQHVHVPRRGVAVHINAFNFPAWGLLGKAAVTIAAGMPLVAKPATSTAAVAHRIVELLVNDADLPVGALQLIVGSVGDLLDGLGAQDVVAFTGSAATATLLRRRPGLLERGVRFNIEADSLNAAIVGPDVADDSELFDLIVRDAVTEITQKAGQKCTATRRLVVPHARLPALRERLVDALTEVARKTGDPRDKANRMGPLATAAQREDARRGIEALGRDAERVVGDSRRSEFSGVSSGCGYFVEPHLFVARAERAAADDAVFNELEVFGPVATLLPYDGTLEEAASVVAAGRGCLVGTLYSDDRSMRQRALLELAPWMGRLVLAGEKIAGASFAPGMVLPAVQHGGPGRAGDGAELGGLIGMSLFSQRIAVQGSSSELARLIGDE